MASKAFSANMKNIERFEQDLERFSKIAVPIANQKALSAGAKDARDTAREYVGKHMILKNKWTKGSIQHENAKGLFMSQQAAIVGSRQEYMADQEWGATKGKAGGKEGIRMTTSFAAGQGMKTRKRTKLARKGRKISQIRLKKSKRNKLTKMQRQIVAIKQASKDGRKHVFLDFPGRPKSKGIYEISGGKTRKSGKKSRVKIKMIHSLHKDSVVIKRNPWLKPSVDKVIPRMQRHYQTALAQQRHFFKKRYDLR